MPIQVFPSSHGAEPIKANFAKSPMDVLEAAWPSSRFNELLQSSFTQEDFPPHLMPSTNGFVKSIVQAYNNHRHLKFRPEDVWFAVLTQMSLYINKNAEELRGKFVAHEGKKELVIQYGGGDRYSFDFGIFAQDMSKLLEANVVDPELREWMMPDFSTTTRQDNVIASILMMGSLQKYFDFKCCCMCGIPSVTLLGEKEDYVKILGRLDKLATFGDETTKFGELLKPIISWMIKTFEDPTGQGVIDFWQKVVSLHNQGSGPSYYSGWVTAFCFWDEDGKSMYHPSGQGLKIDGAEYHRIDTDNVPPGWGKVPVKVDDNGQEVETEMVAGSVAMECSASQETQPGSQPILDTVQPASGWWIYAKQAKEPKAIAELRTKAKKAGLTEDWTAMLVSDAERTGRVPSDSTIEMYSRYN